MNEFSGWLPRERAGFDTMLTGSAPMSLSIKPADGV
ncbi:hypothetical protein BH20CHL1_BH20CHL1_10280 [soil metagenome]